MFLKKMKKYFITPQMSLYITAFFQSILRLYLHRLLDRETTKPRTMHKNDYISHLTSVNLDQYSVTLNLSVPQFPQLLEKENSEH